MPKAKFYAVARGRSPCPHIYRTWDECKQKVTRFPGAVFKSFDNQEDATTWLASKYVHRPSTSAQAPAPSTARPELFRSQKPYSRPAKGERTESESQAPPEEAPSEPNVADATPGVTLSPEQSKVLERILQGENTFFSGSAGTGKSVLLREIIRHLGGKSNPTLGITAATGIAAINISGCTLHSWAGIGIGTEPAKKVAGKFLGQREIFKKYLTRWRDCQTLIIDEISMIDGKLFDKLEEMARILRNNDRPFGGIQLVLSGDFFQLPPVPSRHPATNQVISANFAFEAHTWDLCMGPPVILTRVFRQKDRDFVDLLNAMRLGEIQNEEAFLALEREVKYDDGIEPTELLSRRDEVERANAWRLDKLPGECHTYEASDYAGYNSKGERVSREQMRKLLERLVCPQTISLKIGAQVMLVKNLVQGLLVNGSVGQVIKFVNGNQALEQHLEIARIESKAPQGLPADKTRIWPLVRFTNGAELLMIPQEFDIPNADGEMEARRDQVPLILAWALSVHKSQGQTIERVRVDMKNTFEKGQAYVAVSRATTMEGLQILNFSSSKVMAHPEVLKWHAACQKNQITLVQDDDDIDIDDEEIVSSDDPDLMEEYYK